MCYVLFLSLIYEENRQGLVLVRMLNLFSNFKFSFVEDHLLLIVVGMIVLL